MRKVSKVMGSILLSTLLSLSFVNVVKAMEEEQETYKVTKMIRGVVNKIKNIGAAKLIEFSVVTLGIILLLAVKAGSKSVEAVGDIDNLEKCKEALMGEKVELAENLKKAFSRIRHCENVFSDDFSHIKSCITGASKFFEDVVYVTGKQADRTYGNSYEGSSEKTVCSFFIRNWAPIDKMCITNCVRKEFDWILKSSCSRLIESIKSIIEDLDARRNALDGGYGLS